jgi:hypothetical protein
VSLTRAELLEESSSAYCGLLHFLVNSHGINPRAVAAWIISFAPNLPGLISAVNPAIKSVNPYTVRRSDCLRSLLVLSLTSLPLNPLKQYSFSWFFGTFVAGGCYWVFCEIWPPHDSFDDEAVWDLAVEDPPTPASEVESKKGEEVSYVLPVKDESDRV